MPNIRRTGNTHPSHPYSSSASLRQVSLSSGSFVSAGGSIMNSVISSAPSHGNLSADYSFGFSYTSTHNPYRDSRATTRARIARGVQTVALTPSTRVGMVPLLPPPVSSASASSTGSVLDDNPQRLPSPPPDTIPLAEAVGSLFLLRSDYGGFLASSGFPGYDRDYGYGYDEDPGAGYDYGHGYRDKRDHDAYWRLHNDRYFGHLPQYQRLGWEERPMFRKDLDVCPPTPLSFS